MGGGGGDDHFTIARGCRMTKEKLLFKFNIFLLQLAAVGFPAISIDVFSGDSERLDMDECNQ